MENRFILYFSMVFHIMIDKIILSSRYALDISLVSNMLSITFTSIILSSGDWTTFMAVKLN